MSITPSAPKEIFEGLTKILKSNFEFQFKILISFLKSNKEKFIKDAMIIFPSKCLEIFNSKLDISFSNETIQNIIFVIKSNEEFKNDNFLKTNFISFLITMSSNNTETTNKILDNQSLQLEVKIIFFNKKDFENYIQYDLKEPENIEFEKIFTEMGYLIINQQNSKNEVTIKFDEKRFSVLLLFLLKHQIQALKT